MLDWVQEIIHVPALGLVAVAVLGSIPVFCYNAFAWVEDGLSVSVKQEITAWLKSAGDFATQHSLSFNLLRFHNQLFVDKQLSVKCLFRTTLFSLISCSLVFLPFIIAVAKYIPRLPLIVNEKIFDSTYTFFAALLFVSFIFIILPLDFLGVAVTRKLSSLASNNVTLKKVALIFMADTLAKAVIFPILYAVVILIVATLMLIINNTNA